MEEKDEEGGRSRRADRRRPVHVGMERERETDRERGETHRDGEGWSGEVRRASEGTMKWGKSDRRDSQKLNSSANI